MGLNYVFFFKEFFRAIFWAVLFVFFIAPMLNHSINKIVYQIFCIIFNRKSELCF